MIGTGGRGPDIFTRMPFFTAAVKIRRAVNIGAVRPPRGDHQAASPAR